MWERFENSMISIYYTRNKGLIKLSKHYYFLNANTFTQTYHHRHWPVFKYKKNIRDFYNFSQEMYKIITMKTITNFVSWTNESLSVIAVLTIVWKQIFDLCTVL